MDPVHNIFIFRFAFQLNLVIKMHRRPRPGLRQPNKRERHGMTSAVEQNRMLTFSLIICQIILVISSPAQLSHHCCKNYFSSEKTQNPENLKATAQHPTRNIRDRLEWMHVLYGYSKHSCKNGKIYTENQRLTRLD